VIRLNSDEQDFNKNIRDNYRLKDHYRRWEHTKDKSKNTLTPDPNAELREPPKSVENEAISNILVSQFIETLDEIDRKIFIRKRLGYTQSEIAKELGFSNNGAVSKRLADIKNRFLEMIK
jgi:DNA-directed RNA polymerase specialized sigma24 family protein